MGNWETLEDELTLRREKGLSFFVPFWKRELISLFLIALNETERKMKIVY
jgi:hypothetical protein